MNFPWIEIAAGTALPAAGAFIEPAFSTDPLPLVEELVFTVTYTPDGAATNPRPQFRLAWSDDGTTPIYDTDLLDSPTASGVYAVQSVGIGLLHGIIPDITGFPESYDICVRNPGGHRYMRLEPAELGDTAHPGTIGIVVRGVT